MKKISLSILCFTIFYFSNFNCFSLPYLNVTWHRILGYDAIDKIVTTPTYPNIIYIGSTSFYKLIENEGVVERLFDDSIDDFAVDPSNGDNIYIVSDYRLLFSNDGGSSWETINYWYGMSSIGLYKYNINILCLGVPSASGGYSVIKSSDGGDTFTEIRYTTSNSNSPECLLISSNNPDRIFVGSWDDGLYKIEGEEVIHLIEGLYIYSIVEDPKNPNSLYIGTDDGIYKSTNGGDSWVQISFFNKNIYTLKIDPNNTNILYSFMRPYYTSTDSGVYRSSDGGYNWTYIGGKISNDRASSIALSPLNQNIIFIGCCSWAGLWKTNLQETSNSLTITSPNSSTIWEQNKTYSIRWDKTGSIERINLKILTGDDVIDTKTNLINDGEYEYTPMFSAGNDYRIKIEDYTNKEIKHYSDYFNIVENGGPPQITVLTPNGGESWIIGTSHYITWTSSGSVGNVKIEYSTNNGSSWSTITYSISNDGSYSWHVPNTPSTQCLVRISETDGYPTDTSDSTFSIVSASTPTITITSPNGRQTWPVGSTKEIKWTTTGSVGNLRVEYSINGGSSWILIDNSTINDGSRSWIIPNTPSLNCLVKLTSVDNPSISDTSDLPFVIYDPSIPASITVISPNGGESWLVGTTQMITWTTSGLADHVKIEYSTNGGNNWAPVENHTQNDGIRPWVIPDEPSSNCKIKISSYIDSNIFDVSNASFSIFSSGGASISLTSPNGGEIWEVGSVHNITWTSTGTVDDVKLWYSTDGGSSWSTIVSSTANDGSYSWNIPNDVSSQCKVRISDTDGSPSDTSDSVFSIVSSSTPPQISLNRTHLYFGATTSGVSTPSQSLFVDNSGGGSLNWSVSDDKTWLSCTTTSGTGSGTVTVSVDPTGLSAGTYLGTITVSDPNASNSPQTVLVTLRVYGSGHTSSPFGTFATPLDGSTVSSSIPVTGWALDDIGVANVKIYRGNTGALVYIGDVLFVEGARPDIEQAYPDYPMNYKAGWGYMMLTNFLPNGGNGTFKIHAIATDVEGHQVTLGTKTITVDNASAVKPFGAIDTPTQGGTASGSSFRNHGWVLTPMPNSIPTDGSTIIVYVDGMGLGHPIYNVYRSDIAALFPGYANKDGAGGYFDIDTTAYTNGVHTIYWTAQDNAGNTDGIGSRYFTIQNTGGSRAKSAITQMIKFDFKQISELPVDFSYPISVKQGYGKHIEPRIINSDDKGIVRINIKELERIEIQLADMESEVNGYVVDGDKFRPLPIGSIIKNGLFFWVPVPGFLGDYRLIFVMKDQNGDFSKREILIRIEPKYGLKK